MGENNESVSNATESPSDNLDPVDVDWQTDFVCVNCEGDVDDGREGSFQNEYIEEMDGSKVFL